MNSNFDHGIILLSAELFDSSLVENLSSIKFQKLKMYCSHFNNVMSTIYLSPSFYKILIKDYVKVRGNNGLLSLFQCSTLE